MGVYRRVSRNSVFVSFVISAAHNGNKA